MTQNPPARPELPGGDPPERPELPEDDVPMTVFEHLGELRTRLIRSILGMLPGMAIAWEYREPLFEFLVAPLMTAMRDLGVEPQLHFASPIDPFVAYLKIAVVCGLLFASPWVFIQIWGFVAPGLYARERMYAIPFVLASTVFFAGGAFFGYAVVFPMGFQTLIGIGIGQIHPTIMVNDYLTFATRMLLAFGVVFEIPVVVTFLSLTGVVNWKQLWAFGRWWLLISSVLAAFLTPPDVGSQLLMLVPLVVLYFLSVGIAYLLGPKPPEDEAEAGASP